MILVVTLVAMMGLARILLNSFVMVSGSTMFTWRRRQETHVHLQVLFSEVNRKCSRSVLA